MSEDQWLTCADPKSMLAFLLGKVSDRKLRLFSCACCRRIWRLFNEKERKAVEAAENFADGTITWQQLDAVWDADGVTAVGHTVDGATSKDTRWGADWAATNEIQAAFEREATTLRRPFSSDPAGIRAWAAARLQMRDATQRRENIAQVNLLREIFGNPFRPAIFDPTWRTLTAVALAQAMYEQRNGDRLLDLADDLERAGCLDQPILGHCREAGGHVRGCWVVDLVLGKE